MNSLLRTIPDFMLILISFSFPWEFLSDMNNTFQLQTVLPYKISWRAITLVYISLPHILLKKLQVFFFQIFLQPGISWIPPYENKICLNFSISWPSWNKNLVQSLSSSYEIKCTIIYILEIGWHFTDCSMPGWLTH